jgi:hypothetical protein
MQIVAFLLPYSIPSAYNITIIIKEAIPLTNQELERLVNKLYQKSKSVPGIDREFIQKCLTGIAALGDSEVDAKLALLITLL